MPTTARFTPTIRHDVFEVAHRLGFELNSPAGYDQALLDYALLVYVTNVPLDQAARFLREAGAPEDASERVLLRAWQSAAAPPAAKTRPLPAWEPVPDTRGMESAQAAADKLCGGAYPADLEV